MLRLHIYLSSEESDKLYRYRWLDLEQDKRNLTKEERREYDELKHTLSRMVLNEAAFQHMIQRPLD